MNKNIIYTGSRAKRTLKKIFESSDFSESLSISTPDYSTPFPVSGYYQEKEKWIAFDNTTGECLAEEFETKEEATEWVKK